MNEPSTNRALRFHQYGEPSDVLRLEAAPVPEVAPQRVRVAVRACGLNPADWALCRGLLPGQLPRGVGLDVAGVVGAVGEGVSDVAVGDRVVGSADFAGSTSAGAADVAVLDSWARLPASVDFVDGAALPLAVETAFRHLDAMGVKAGQTVVVNGAGTAVGFAAVQIALGRGARVVATAGETYAERLRALGAKVTSYGDGMGARLRELAGGDVDAALDAAPRFPHPELANKLVSGAAVAVDDAVPTSGPLVELVQAAGGDAKRVVTISDFHDATKLGVRTTFELLRSGAASSRSRSDVLAEFVARAGEGKLAVPVARVFELDEWREAVAISLSGQARGKLVLRCGGGA